MGIVLEASEIKYYLEFSNSETQTVEITSKKKQEMHLNKVGPPENHLTLKLQNSQQ